MLPLVLASSSAYRKLLLERLVLNFITANPEIDESPAPHEQPSTLALRLAEEKAQALASRFPQHLIIGSDQVAALHNQCIGKPNNFDTAFAQLRAASGQSVTFYTGLALFNSQSKRLHSACIPFTVYFRELSDDAIERYLRLEQPYDCAGSFKAEGLGVSLFQRTEGEDATSLIGLPLIRLVDFLTSEGYSVP